MLEKVSMLLKHSQVTCAIRPCLVSTSRSLLNLASSASLSKPKGSCGTIKSISTILKTNCEHRIIYPESERWLSSNFILEAHLQDRRGGSCYLRRSEGQGACDASEEGDNDLLEHVEIDGRRKKATGRVCVTRTAERYFNPNTRTDN